MSSLVAKLEVVVKRHDEIQALLADHPEPGGADYTRLTREYAEMNPIVEQMRGFQKLVSSLYEATTLAESEDDPDMRAMAEDEARELRMEIENKEQEMKVLLLPRDEADSRNAILEIRPGTGGDEAGLFAGDLLNMYRRFAELQGWKFETIELTENDVGGLKEASIRVSGTNVFAALKFESGVHRVQRVPVTESGGRIHTSAATVAVLPEAEDVDIEIRAEDIRIDTMRASGAGGQHVNTTDSAVRITHLPTGI
ncbi:MAG: PCRF domain-containing protein, partial [Rhodospirillaceae bacterium]